MTAEVPPPPAHPAVDREHDPSRNPFDEPASQTGQAYSQDRERAMGRAGPSGHPLVGDHATVDPPHDDPEGHDLPPENGRRAWIDPHSGEVHGSGSGAGGGNEGEDFDEQTPGGA